MEGSRSSICLIWGLPAAAASMEERSISGLLSRCCMACCHMGFCTQQRQHVRHHFSWDNAARTYRIKHLVRDLTDTDTLSASISD